MVIHPYPQAPLPASAGTESSYSLYGITVRSRWRLPFAAAPPGSAPAIDIVPGEAEAFRAAAELVRGRGGETDWFTSGPLPGGEHYLRWEDLFECIVSAAGERIACRPLEAATYEAFHTYLLGQALSFALLKQGVESIHATAVVVDGAAVAFLGNSGHGKSSLAAAFLAAGHPLLTDDLLVAERRNGHLVGQPGPPRIKLFPEVARRFFGSRAEGVPMNPLTEKLILPLPPEACSGPVPLRAMYVLAAPAGPHPDGVLIQPLSGRAAFMELSSNTYNARLLDSARLRNQFQAAARLAEAVPVRRLSFPRSLDLLHRVRERIVADAAA